MQQKTLHTESERAKAVSGPAGGPHTRADEQRKTGKVAHAVYLGWRNVPVTPSVGRPHLSPAVGGGRDDGVGTGSILLDSVLSPSGWSCTHLLSLR